MENIIAMQARMKQEAEEQANMLASVRDWMDTIKVKDAQLRQETLSNSSSSLSSSSSSQRRSTTKNTTDNKNHSNRIPSSHDNNYSGTPSKEGSAANHTYDKGYKKWESFNADAALEEIDQPNAPTNKFQASSPSSSNISSLRPYTAPSPSSSDLGSSLQSPPAPRNPIEEMREAGNTAIQKGDYQLAVKHYNRMILLDNTSYIGYANRSQAYLYLKEYRLAIYDCNDSLRRNPTHVKSWMRRATARAALGMYESAVRDLSVARLLDPTNKVILADLRKYEESCRANQRRIPDVHIPVEITM